MAGKRGLIMGVANNRSIAWGIAKAAAAQGAELAFTYQGDALEEARRAARRRGRLQARAALRRHRRRLHGRHLRASSSASWGKLDFLVHAIAFSDKNELDGRYVDTSEKNFAQTMLISCYSLHRARRSAPRR